MHASFVAGVVDPRSVIDAEPEAAFVAEEVLRRFEAGTLTYSTHHG
jgi:hypothetical protein